MAKRSFVAALVIAGVLVAAPDARALPFTFAVVPADISGAPGDTVGWGYSITNTSGDFWLLLTDLSLGTFSDGVINVLFDAPSIAPLDTVVRSYDPGVAGLAEFTWDPTAPIGSFNSGFFEVTGEFYLGDPSLGVLVDVADPQRAAYSVTATGSTPVPEPGTLLLLSVGAAALAFRRRTSRS